MLQSAELLDDHHRGTNDRYLDDHDLLEDDRDLLEDDHDLPEDDPLNHHDHTTDDHRDRHDLLTDGHDLLEDDPLNHHDRTKDDHRDLLTDDHDLGHHFVHTQDDLLDDYLDGLGVRHDPLMDDRYLVDRDCPKDDLGLRLVCLNDRLLHRDGRDAMVCRILLPVADDVDRDFLGLALGEVYLQTTRKRRTYAICD